MAEAEERILLTLDRGFWQIGVQRRVPLEHAGVVLLRADPATPENLEPLVRTVVDVGELWKGRIAIVSSEGIQMVSSSKG